MQRLFQKRIIVGIGGGIAAYKSAELVRRLRDLGADVHVVMTRGAREFLQFEVDNQITRFQCHAHLPNCKN